jgi:predicted nucleic acid-binding protein
MRKVLVDTSAWIDYFAGGSYTVGLSDLIENNIVCSNDIILTELLPALYHRKEDSLVDFVSAVEKMPLKIDWQKIIQAQTVNLRHGLNRVSLPDLIIVQNAIDYDLELFSLDKHFLLMRKLFKFKMFNV